MHFQRLKRLRHATTVAVVLLTAVHLSAMSPAHAGIEEGANAFLQSLAKKATASLTEADIPRPERIKRFRVMFRENFAVRSIGKFVLGRNWRRASEDEQKEYMSMMEDKYNKFSLAGLGELEVPNVENEKQKFSMEDLMKKFESLDSENKELKQNLFSLVNKTDKKLDEENNLLRQQIQEIKSQEKRKEVIKFVNDKLIESNKFDVADRERLENGLTAIATASNQAIKFSVSGQEVATDAFSFVAEMLEKAAVKNTFSHSPIVAHGENGLTVTRQEIEKSNGASVDELLQDKKIRFAHKDKDFSSMSESELQAIYEQEGII